MTAVRDDDPPLTVAELRALALHLATFDRRAAAATAVTHVLHELGNPTAVLLSNLRFVGDALAQLEAAIPVETRRLLGELQAAVDDAALAAQELAARIDRFRLCVDEPAGAANAGGTTVGASASRSADLARVIDGSLALVAHLAADGAQLERRLPASLPRVAASPEHLGAVLIQLLLNACEAEPTRITVGATHLTDGAGSRITLTVDDDGAGVPEALRPRLAHPLASSKAGVARGLGLAAARAVLDRLGGELHVLHPTLGGTSVRVLLPVVLD